MKTGWPPGLLQDDDRKLSRWFAGRPSARHQVRENIMEKQSEALRSAGERAMNRDDVIRMAREATWYADKREFGLEINEWWQVRDERFAALVAAAEREACAKVCEDDALSHQYGERSKYRALLADTIRARGQA